MLEHVLADDKIAVTLSGRRLAFALFVNNVHVDSSDETNRHGQTLGRLCEIAYEAW
jgi:hypothetical protein